MLKIGIWRGKSEGHWQLEKEGARDYELAQSWIKEENANGWLKNYQASGFFLHR